jgi:hypothetical protein
MGQIKYTYTIFNAKHEEQGKLRSCKLRWDNTETYLNETGWVDVERSDMAEDRDRR